MFISEVLCISPPPSTWKLIKDFHDSNHAFAHVRRRSIAAFPRVAVSLRPFFHGAQIVWGFGDHQHNCRHHEYVSLSCVLKGLRLFLYELKLQMRFISSTKDTKGLFLFRMYPGKTIGKRISSLFYTWKLVPLKKKKKKVWHCTFNLRRVKQG